MSELHQDHDLDLLAAFAEGRLSDPAPAEAMIAACPECAEVFESHRTVLEAVRRQTPAVLDDLERRRLRAAVWGKLQEEPSPAVVTPVPARRSATPWWYRVVPVAAALVVVVGVAANLVPRGGDADTTADLTSEGPGVDRFDSSEAAPETTAASEATITADASATTTAGASPTTGSDSGEGGTSQAADSGMEEAAAEFARRAVADEEAVDEEARECVAADPEAEGDAVASESTAFDSVEAWLVGLGTPTEVERVTVYAADDCRVLYRSE